MKTIRGLAGQAGLLLALLLILGRAEAALVNGDFESGSLGPWVTYTTANGTMGQGSPTTSIFDVEGLGSASYALGLSVGYATAPCSFPGIYCPLPTEGGGIRQTVNLPEGQFQFGASVAVANSSLYGGFNGDGGTFSVYLDGTLLDSFVFGAIAAGSVQRGQLGSTAYVTAGSHALELMVTRNSAASLSLTQYVDNVSIAAVPLPATLIPMALGMFCLAPFAVRRRVAA